MLPKEAGEEGTAGPGEVQRMEQPAEEQPGGNRRGTEDDRSSGGRSAARDHRNRPPCLQEDKMISLEINKLPF